MKRVLGLLSVIVMLAMCHRPTVETMYTSSLQPNLAAIDTLMQTWPDSALTLLLDEPTDEPYYQLLLSEALYKNYYTQTNRTELLASLAYFDSVQDPFLSARCHYMNGVAYYEMDSVVQACEEYMTAIQIMEEHYSEKELTGHKAKFMALTYLRLTILFSDQYLHEQAVFFGKQSLSFYNKHDAESWNIPWVLREIGSQYDMMGQLEDADYYYRMAMDALSDTCTLTYRDIASLRMLLYYHKENKSQVSLKQLHKLLTQAQSNNEYLSRCAVIGDIYYCEQQLDSAWFYLNKVYSESTNVNLKKQAAEFLAEICKSLGKDAEFIEYAGFLVPFANQEENKSEIKSRLTELYQMCIQNNTERSYRNKIKGRMIVVLIVFGILIIVLSVAFALYHANRKTKRGLEKQFEAERLAHKLKQKALSGRLRRSNENLQELKEKVKQQDALKKTENEADIPFAEEPICTHILKLCNDENLFIKTSISVSEYSDIALTDKQKAMLKQVAIKHYGDLFQWLKTNYPNLKEKDFSYLYLCLLGLNNTQIAALMQLSYSTIWEREKRLQHVFNSNEKISVILNGFLIH